MNTACSDVIVLFGATGDLAFKEIFPALFGLYKSGRFYGPVIGIARSSLSDGQFHQRARDSLIAKGCFQEDVFEAFVRNLSYLSGDYREPATYERLAQRLNGFMRPLFYMAIPPGMFETVTQGVASLGRCHESRLVIEKPFGRNLASARALNKNLLQCFPEKSLFRLDHFLALEAVENLVYFRFANSFLQPLWCRDHIKSVQITMAERFGVEGRGAFYEEVGAVRDVVQNHLFQILSLLAMEPSRDISDYDALHAEQHKLFRRVRPVRVHDVVSGQFAGYRNEPGVHVDSNTETYVAMRLSIDNVRWCGVPFYIRTGKCLPVTCTEIMITLNAPVDLMPGQNVQDPVNYLRFRLDPDMQIALGAQVRRPGSLVMTGQPVELLACDEHYDRVTPYERLLGDAIMGDDRLFTRPENIEAAWCIVENILDRPSGTVVQYEPGSWGPDSRAVLINGDHWHDPVVKPEQSLQDGP